MSVFDKVFNLLVVEGREASAKQMASWFGTTTGTISARVSELRTQEGFATVSYTHLTLPTKA